MKVLPLHHSHPLPPPSPSLTPPSPLLQSYHIIIVNMSGQDIRTWFHAIAQGDPAWHSRLSAKTTMTWPVFTSGWLHATAAVVRPHHLYYYHHRHHHHHLLLNHHHHHHHHHDHHHHRHHHRCFYLTFLKSSFSLFASFNFINTPSQLYAPYYPTLY